MDRLVRRTGLRVAKPRAVRAQKQSGRDNASPVNETRWTGLSVTKGKLTEVLGGRAVRNIGGVVYTITAPTDNEKITSDDITITDSFGLSYPAHIDKTSGVIKADLANGTGAIAGFQLSPSDALKATGFSKGAEAINGRAAMLGFVFAAAGEIRDGATLGKQMLSFGGFAGMLFWSLVATAGTIAPVATGKKRCLDDCLPDENDPSPDQPLPYYFTPKAEGINGKGAMVGIALLLLIESLTRSPLL